MVDVDTGLKPDNNTKKIIYESFKLDDNFLTGLEKSVNKYKLESNDSQNKEKTFKFY